MLQDKCYSNIKNHEFYYLTAERKFWCNRSMSVVLLKCYLKGFCTDQFHYNDLDSGWTLNNHLNAELFRSDNSNKPVNSKNVRPVDTRKTVCCVNSSTLISPVNSNNFVLPVDICTIDSNKSLHPVNSS